MEGDDDLRNGTFDNGTAADELLDAPKTHLDRKNSEERSMIADRLSAAEQTVYALENQNKDLQAQLDELNGHINIVKEDKKSLVGEKTELESQLENSTKEIESLEVENGVLLEERSQLELQNNQLNKENEGLSGLLVGTQCSLEEIERERDELSAKIESLSDQVEGLVKENEELKGRISHLDHLESEKEVLGSSLRKELDRLREENGRLTIQLEEAQKEIGLLREEKGSLQDQLKESRHEIAELKRILEEMDEKSASQIEALKEKCLKLENEKEKQRNEIGLLHAQKGTVENELLNVQRTGKDDQQVSYLEGIHSGKRGLMDENSNLENEVKRLGEMVEESEKLKERIREFEVAFEDVHKAIETKDNTIQQLTLELQALQVSPANEKQKSRTFPWSAVIVSGALFTASAAVLCHKYAKLH